MKKLLSFLLVCTMVLSLGLFAFASGEAPYAKLGLGDVKKVILGNASAEGEMKISLNVLAESQAFDGVILKLTYDTNKLAVVTQNVGGHAIPKLTWHTDAFDNAMTDVQVLEDGLKLVLASGGQPGDTPFTGELVDIFFKLTDSVGAGDVGATIDINGTVDYSTLGLYKDNGGAVAKGGIQIIGTGENGLDGAPDTGDENGKGVIHHEPQTEASPSSDGHQEYWWQNDPDPNQTDPNALIYYDVDPELYLDDDPSNDPEGTLDDHKIGPVTPYEIAKDHSEDKAPWKRNPTTEDGNGKTGWPDDYTLRGEDGKTNPNNTSDTVNSDDEALKLSYKIGDVNNDKVVDLRDINLVRRFQKLDKAVQDAVKVQRKEPEITLVDGTTKSPFYFVNAYGTDKGDETLNFSVKEDLVAANVTNLFRYISDPSNTNNKLRENYTNHEDIISVKDSVWLSAPRPTPTAVPAP